MRLSSSSQLDFTSNNINNSLAIREAVVKLSLSPHETVKFLNGEKCIWSDNDDKAVLCALKVLKKFYIQLKKDLGSAESNPEVPIDSKSLLRFLVSKDNETTREVISRHKEEEDRKANWVQLKIADRDNPSDVLPIPPIVPPLDQNEFRTAVSGWSEDSAVDDSDNEKEQLPEQSKSSSSASTPINLDPNENLLWQTQKASRNVMKIVHKVDKAISPRTESSNQSTPRKPSSQEISTSRYFARVSKAIQTDFEFIRPKTADAAVSVHFESFDSKITESSATTTSLQKIIGISSEETTATSSLFSSGLSAGEVPLKTAAKLTSKQKFTVVSVHADGSFASAASNYQAFRQTHGLHYYSSPSLIEAMDEISFKSPILASTPIDMQKTTFTTNRPPRLRPFSSTTFTSQPAQRFSSLTFGTSSKVENTPLVVPEQAVRTITVTPASDNWKKATNNLNDQLQGEFQIIPNFDDINDDESTLHQISPLPSGE